MKKWWILLSAIPLLAYAVPHEKVSLQEEAEEPFKENQWISSIESDLFNEIDAEDEVSSYVAEQVDEEESLFPWVGEENQKDELSSSFYYEDEFDNFAEEEESREVAPPQKSERTRPQPSYEKIPQRSQSAQYNRTIPKKREVSRDQLSEAPARAKPRENHETPRQRPSVSASGRQRENYQPQERAQARPQQRHAAQRPQQRPSQRNERLAPRREARSSGQVPKRHGQRAPSRNAAAAKRNGPTQSERSVRVRPLQRQENVKSKGAHPGRHPTAANEQGSKKVIK